MTISVSYARTMAGARQIVVDDGFNITPRRKREAVTMLSLRWQAEQEAKRRADEVIQEAKERARNAYGSTPRILISMVAAWHGLGELDLFSASRRAPIVAAKHDAIAAVYLNCRIDGRRYSLPELGRLFAIDHTTAMHALRKRGLK